MKKNIISILFITLIPLFAITTFYLYINNEYNNLKKFEIKSESNKDNLLSKKTNYLPKLDTEINSVNFLLFSLGSKGIDKDNIDRLGIGSKRANMSDGLTDSIMVVNYNKLSQLVNVISIPRDLYLEKYGNRINTLYNNKGVDVLVREVEELTKLGIDHYAAVNFDFFVSMYDLLGGVKLDIPYPVRDNKAKLNIEVAGCKIFTGSELLAFARSRNWLIFKDGRWQSDNTSSDWGRIDRQQYLVRESVKQLFTYKLFFNIRPAIDIVNKNLIIDHDLSLYKMLNILTSIVKDKPSIKAYTYPGYGATVNEMSVIIPDFERAEIMLNKFKNNNEYLDNNALTNTNINSPWLDNKGNGGSIYYKSCN